jgi:mgtE-like transporter
MRRRLPLAARFSALLGPDAAGVRQGLVALSVGLLASLVAGLTLGAITDTLEELPGLLILVPAAIGLRGTVFGALGARLGTSIHAGTFRLTGRVDTVLGQNVLAAFYLTSFASLALAVMAKVVSVGFGLEESISIGDFIVISLVGGAISSAVVLVLTVALAAGSVRYGWDPDNVTAPLVTASGDMITLPALFLATYLIDIEILTPLLAGVGVVIGIVALAAGLSARYALTRRVVRESVLVVLGAGSLSLIAGHALEQRLESLARYPALLALVPPFLAAGGALGGILSSRLTSKLHLGTIDAEVVPSRGSRSDIAFAYVLAVPVFALSSLVADVAAVLVDLRSPGPLDMVAIALVGGLLATTFAVAIAYYGAIASYRLGLDPDNVGIPLVTSSLDLVGALSFILAVVLIGAG